jgi:hypothetical protein
LRIGIAPSANFEPSANPAQTLGRVRGAIAATYDTLRQFYNSGGIRHSLRICYNILRNDGLVGWYGFAFQMTPLY